MPDDPSLAANSAKARSKGVELSFYGQLGYSHPAPQFMDGWNVRWHFDGNYRSSTYSRLSIWDASVDR